MRPALPRAWFVRAAITCVVVVAAGRAGAQELPPSAGGDRARDRMLYLMQQRSYPFERVPPGALMQARLEAMRAPRAALLGSAVSPMGPWQPIGPAPIATIGSLTAGRVSAVAVHPTNSNIIYIGAAQGGVWKTIDGGLTWTPLTDTQCSLAIGALTIDPVNPNIIYAGTGEENFAADSYYGCGILRSVDGGASWTALGQSTFQTGSGGAQIGKILIDRATAGTVNATLFAATSFGVYKSVNGGVSWVQVLSKGFGYATDLIAPPIQGSPIFAAATSSFVNAANGIYKSVDGGITWNVAGGGLPLANVGRVALSVSPANPNVMYAAVEDPRSGNLQGLYRTNDGGTTWTSFAAAGANCSVQCWYAMTVTPSPTDTSVVFFGGLSLYRSGDLGATFSTVGGQVHVDHHALTFDPSNPQVVYAGTDGGIFRSTDGGFTWTSLNTNLAITQFYGGISMHPTAAFPVLGGTQDNGTLEYRGVPGWSAVIGGDGGYTATNPLTPATAYGETQWPGGPRRRTTTNGSFFSIVNGINLNDVALFIPPLVLDNAHPSFVYFGTTKLYRTKSGGDSWSAISPDFSSNVGISAIGVAQSDTQVVYVGAAGQVQVTTNGGGSWAPATAGIPNRTIKAFAVNAAHPEIAYVVVSGFNTGHVFKTVNRGATWADISGNLPNVPVNAIVVIPGGELFVGTDLGVYRSGDDGASWGVASSGIPNVAVFDLAYSLPAQTLVAATHGRSVWAASVMPTLTATQIAISSAPARTPSGTPIFPAPVVRVAEVTGVAVPGASNLVTASITAGGGALTGTTSVAASNGVATFSNLIVTGSGAQTITFSSPGLASASIAVGISVPTTVAVAPASTRDTVFLGATTAHTDSAAVTLAGDTGPTTAWIAARLKPWITLTTANGTGTGRVRWTRNPTGLALGVFVDTITITATGAGGSPQRIVDSLVVRPASAVAFMAPDSIRGAKSDPAPFDLIADVSALPGILLGNYSVDITWDSTVVRLDSARAIVGGFVAPVVTTLNAGAVRLAAADPAGKAGSVGLSRLFYRFVSDVNARSTIVPAFTVLSSTTSASLLATVTTRGATAIDAGVLRGDVNGDGVVNVADAQLILQAATGLPLTAPSRGLPNGDTNCNGKLEAVDAQIIMAFVLGMPVSQFCVNKVR